MYILKKIIMVFIFLLSGYVYAENSNFDVKVECISDFSCNVNQYLNGKKTIVFEDVKFAESEKINNNLFKVFISCGSPCSNNIFIDNKGNQDFTLEYIAIDSKNNCLIESDTKKKNIYARKLFQKKKKVIADLSSKRFNSFDLLWPYYLSFNTSSYFDKNENLHLIIKDEPNFLEKINKPCE